MVSSIRYKPCLHSDLDTLSTKKKMAELRDINRNARKDTSKECL